MAREFRLSPSLASAVSACSGLPVPGAGVLHDPEPPLEQIKEAGLVEPGSEHVRRDLLSALVIINDPVCAITIAAGVPEQQSWERLTAYGGRQPDDGFAAVSTASGTTVIAVIPTPEALAHLTGKPLRLHQLPPPESETVRLGVAAWSALLAIADDQRQRELAATLARDPAPAPDEFTLAQLAATAAEGWNGTDLRWLCTLARALTPVPLRYDQPGLAAGIDALVAAGLTEPGREALRLTPAGRRLMLLLRTIMTVAVIGANRLGESDTEMAVAGVLSSPLGALAVIWEEVAATEAAADLVPLETKGFEGLIERFVGFARSGSMPPDTSANLANSPYAASRPAEAGATAVVASCTNCAAPARSGARFCVNCGARVAGQPACPRCGTPARPGASFCSTCGTPLLNAGADTV